MFRYFWKENVLWVGKVNKNKSTDTVSELVCGQSSHGEKLCKIFEMDRKKFAVIITDRSTCIIFLLYVRGCIFLCYLLLINRNRRCMSLSLFHLSHAYYFILFLHVFFIFFSVWTLSSIHVNKLIPLQSYVSLLCSTSILIVP